MAFHVLQAMLGAAFLLAGLAKLAGARMHVNNFKRWGLSQQTRRLVGVLEIIGGIGMLAGIWLSAAGFVAGLLIAGLMLGAASVHRRMKDSPSQWMPAVVFLLVAVAISIHSAI